MDENSQEMYLQNLEEFVLDEDKIVTYKWLSKTLNIHVNQSKQLLYTFCSSKDKQGSVSATYLLAGRLRSTGENRITVVGQDQYEEAKSSFESLSSEHVYSIQKTKQTPSGGTLFTANSQPVDEKGEGSSSLAAIKCKDSVRRAAEEMALLRISLVPAPKASTSAASKTAPSAPSKQVAASSSSNSKEPEKASPVKNKTDEKNGKEPAGKDAKGKGGLAAMFAAQTSKTSGKAATASTSTSSKNTAKGKKAGGISNFFSKVSKEELAESEAAKAAKELAENEAAKATKEKARTPEKMKKEETIDVSDDDSKSPSPVASKKEKKTELDAKKKATPKASKQTRQKRSRANEKKEDPKKRRRIVAQVSDSSDDDMFAEENNDDEREPSPVPDLQAKALESDEDEDVIPPTPVAESSNGRVRRKRKVTKDKTFMDDDGYIVTQKVNEYESYSESDTENSEAKKVKEQPKPAANGSTKESPSSSKGKNVKSKSTAKKASPVQTKSPLKSKQQSLTNFFKRKD